mmetsp:Transcript_72463/g.143903  ORF Transcript_72463/g.143903 Transcript_72463/m.143903 type:complete len:208 (+) Transcript_72463:1838-2461(+)
MAESQGFSVIFFLSLPSLPLLESRPIPSATATFFSKSGFSPSSSRMSRKYLAAASSLCVCLRYLPPSPLRSAAAPEYADTLEATSSRYAASERRFVRHSSVSKQRSWMKSSTHPSYAAPCAANRGDARPRVDGGTPLRTVLSASATRDGSRCQSLRWSLLNGWPAASDAAAALPLVPLAAAVVSTEDVAPRMAAAEAPALTSRPRVE